MYCKKCGELMEDNVKFCPACGEKQEIPEEAEPVVNAAPTNGGAAAVEEVDIFVAFKRYFQHYADFKTRSRRSEYWWAVLAIGIIGSIIGFISSDLASVWSLVVAIPSLALAVRRLHDIGRSGWWYLINLIPLAGQIIFIVWACQDSAPDNQWGKNPKA